SPVKENCNFSSRQATATGSCRSPYVVIQPVRHAPARATALQYRAMPAALLFDAIKAGDLDGVKALLTADPALVDAKTDAGVSAILTAVYHGRRDIANLLVARGATLTLF